MEARKPRVIRSAIRNGKKVGKDGRYKFARDRKTRITIERVMARAPRPCASPTCPHPNHIGYSKHGIIERNTEYLKVLDPHARGMFIQGRNLPVYEDYHIGCVPEAAKPLVRFVTQVSGNR